MFDRIRRLLIFLVGFTIPLENVGTVSLGPYPVGPNKLVTALLLAFAFLSWPLAGRGIPWNRKYPWVLLFAVGIVAGNLNSVLHGMPVARLAVIWTSFAAVLIFSFLLPQTVASTRDLSRLLAGVVLGCVTAVLAGFVMDEPAVEYGRFLGTAANPNQLALSLSLGLPIMAGFYFATRSPLRKTFLAVASVLAVGGVVASLSRAAFLSLVGMWGLWTLRFGRLQTIRFALPAVLLAVGVALLAPQTFYERMGTISEGTSTENSSSQSRIVMGYWTLRAVMENPILGVGIGKVGEWVNERDPRIAEQHAVHNAFLGVAAEFGFLGLIPMLMFTLLTWMDFSLVRRTARAPDLKRDPQMGELRWWATFLQIAFLGFLIFAMFHPATRDKPFWLLIGLSSALVAMARVRVHELRGRAGAPSPPEPGAAGFGPGWQPQPARAAPR